MVKYEVGVIQQIGAMIDALEVKGRTNHQLIVNILTLLDKGELEKELESEG